MPYCTLPHGSVETGMCLSAFSDTELSRDGSIRLLTKPPVRVRCVPPLQAGDADAGAEAASAGGGGDVDEAARQHRRGRRVADHRRRVALFDAALVDAEREQLFLHDR